MSRALTTAERRFAERMRAAQRQVDAAEEATLRRMIAEVRSLRGEVAGELARVAPKDADGWRAQHLRDIERHLDRVLGEWAGRLTGALNDGVGIAANAGHAALVQALAGTAAEELVRQAQASSFTLHRRQLEKSLSYNADLVRGVGEEARTAIMRRLRRGLTGQRGPVEVMRDVQQYLNVPARPTARFGGLAYQAERVVRTELSRMYNLGNQATMGATAEIAGSDGMWVIWMHSGRKQGARPSHVKLDGTKVPYGSTFNVGGKKATGPHDPSLPAEHVVNCFLPGTRVRGDYVGGLEAWYSGPAREIETRRGVRLAVTVNHPVLAPSGWIKAGDLREGDHLIGDDSDVWDRRLLHDEHDQDMPAAIEDVLQSLAPDRRLLLPMVTALDLYGDGAFIEGEVEIVLTDRALQNGMEASAHKAGGNLGLVETGLVTSDLTRDGAGHLDRVRIALAAPCLVGSRDEGAPLGLGEGGHAKMHRGASSAQGDSGPPESLGHQRATVSSSERYRLDGLAATVRLDEVVKVTDFHYAGHVYDLQSVDGVIMAEGIACSNCRCTSAMWSDAWGER